MGGSQLTVGHATADAADFHGHLRIRHVDFYLFQCTRHIETGGTEDERFLARGGQTGRDANGILFRDAHFHELFWQRLGEICQRGTAAGV